MLQNYLDQLQPLPYKLPFECLHYVYPALHCMCWCRRLGSIGCLQNESSEEDEEERADDEGSLGECPERTRALLEHALGDATEASKLDTSDDVDERRLMLESSATEATGTSSGGVAVEPLPNVTPNAGAAAPAEPPQQVLNVTEILKRNYVSHAEAKLVKPLVKVLEGMFHATNPVLECGILK